MFALFILLLILVQIDFSEEAAPDLILYFKGIVFVHAFKVLSKPSFMKHTIKDSLKDSFLNDVNNY